MAALRIASRYAVRVKTSLMGSDALKDPHHQVFSLIGSSLVVSSFNRFFLRGNQAIGTVRSTISTVRSTISTVRSTISTVFISLHIGRPDVRECDVLAFHVALACGAI